MKKLNKHIVPIGLILSVLFLIIAGSMYPGGKPNDINSVGYSWSENYISHLLDYKAVNGTENKARPFGVASAVIMGITMGIAFFRFSKKVKIKQYNVVIKYLGLLLILLSALITIPSQHDLMVTISSISTLVMFFYITVLFVKSSHKVLKIFSVSSLIIFYGAAYMYFTRTGLDYLPIVQKGIHILQIIWILGLEYYTSEEDFQSIKG
ncbi:MAG: hypothetical protein IPL65_06665 [Lewinellaceae bacterium]|nr:hypothetical protein [Lewinellaceae bacterium]